MKVLLYIEPYPIRDVSVHFKDVARQFLPLLETCPRLDTRLFANKATLNEIKTGVESHIKRIIQPTEEDERIFERHKKDWLSEGLPAWLDLMAGTGQVTADYQQVLERIWQRFPFDIILHWGENGAVSRFIKDRSITRIAMELGCTRPPFLDSLVMDPYGTNGAGMVPKLSITDVRDIVGGVPMSRHEAVLAYSETLEAKPYEQQFQPLSGDFAEVVSRVEKVAFLPLQLFDDANLLRFSPYDTLREVVLDVVPKLAAAGYTTIITPHPATKHRPQGAVATAMAKASLNEWAGQIVWLEPGPDRPENAQLLSMSDVVVTVNSSVGFEALYFDKPVVVLGDAVYKPQDLFPTLEDFLAGRFDQTAYSDGVGWLRRFFLGGYLQSPRVRSDTSSFERLIGLIDWLYRRHANDPLAMAKGFWQAVSPSTQACAESAAFSGLSVVGQMDFRSPSIDLSKPATPVQDDADFASIQWLPAANRMLKHLRLTDAEEFTAWLCETLVDYDGLKTIVTVGDILNPDHYLDLHPDVKKMGMNPLLHYLEYGVIEQRAPQKYLPGVSREGLIGHLSAAADFLLSRNSNLLIHHLLDSKESSWRDSDMEQVRLSLVQSQRRIAVVAHLYYLDLVPEILEKLKAIPEEFDLIVTLPTWGTRRIEIIVREAFPDAMFYHSSNLGRDIGPFVDLLPLLLDKGYDALLKIQTKRGYYHSGRLLPELGDLWRDEAFDSLLGSTERISLILETFRLQPNLTMVGPEQHYLALADYPYHDQGVLAKIALGEAEADGFFAGTMFWIRPDCLRPLVDTLDLSITSFATETGANDGALAHLIERLFGHAATAAGMIMGASTDFKSPLREQPEPLAIRMHERMEQALKDRQARVVKNSRKGALAW